jgi:hypothetical protein
MTPETTWAAVAVAVVGLATAIVRAISGRRRAAPAQPPPAPPPPVPPAPEGRRDAAITAAAHEAVDREAAARRLAPVADLTKPAPSSDDAIEPRDLQ